MITLCLINKIYELSVYPDLLNIAKLFSLKKKSYVTSFGDFRGITITNNFKNIINYMRFKRNEVTYNLKTNQNHAAYRKGIGCELVMYGLSISINKLTLKNKKVYLAISDLNKAFDNVNRAGIIINVYKAGISGRNLRLLHDELKNTKCEIVYNGIHSLQIKINQGVPQGHNEGGPIYNIYTNPTLIKLFQLVKLYVYSKNISAVYYADDGWKIALDLKILQKLIDIESESLSIWNLDCNPNKSKIIKYTRSKNIFNKIFTKEFDIIMNGEKIKWNKINSNIVKFLGFNLNFNIKNYLLYHFKMKIKNFKYLRKKLHFNNTLGANIDIDIQVKLYKIEIRMTMFFGLKSIYLKSEDYRDLESVQNGYMTTIIGCGQKAESLSLRMLLGIPKASDFIIRLKLLMYYDIFKANNDIFSIFIKENYRETFNKYRINNNSMDGIKHKWFYTTYDYIHCIKLWQLDDDYTDINNLPSSKKEWKRIINQKYKEIYRNELDNFLQRNGKIFTLIFGLKCMYDKYKNKIYSGVIDELKIIYNNDTSTKKISKSIKIILNNAKLQYMTQDENGKKILLSTLDKKICPFCRLKRINVFYHLVWLCPNISRQSNMYFLE